MAATTASVVYATQVVHVGSGAALAAGSINVSTDVSTALSSTNLLRYPLADVQLMISHTASLSSLSTALYLYRRDMNVDGTGDEPLPNTVTSTLYKSKLVGVFAAQALGSANTSIQYMQLTDVPLADQCEFYIENATNAAILAGWTLKVLPKTDSFA